MTAEIAVPEDRAGRLPVLAQVVAKHAATFPRFVTEPQSLAEHIDYARRGDWTTSRDGAARTLHIAYVHVFVAPLMTALFALVWSVVRPGRLVTVALVGSVLLTALNTIPGVQWLVPDVLTWTHWPPLSWAAGTEAVG